MLALSYIPSLLFILCFEIGSHCFVHNDFELILWPRDVLELVMFVPPYSRKLVLLACAAELAQLAAFKNKL